MKNKITDISPQVKSKGRYSVFINSKFSFGITEFDLLKLSLKVGDEISDEKLEEIIKTIDESACQEYANSLISAKLYTEKKLKEKLNLKQFSLSSIKNVIDRLKEYGYIDDFTYAKTYIDESKHKYGLFKLKQKLFEKGVPRDIIDECLEDFTNQDTAVVILKTKTRGKQPEKEDYPKLIRFLAQKGFEYEDAKKALNDFLEEFDVE